MSENTIKTKTIPGKNVEDHELTKYFYLQFQYIFVVNTLWWLLSVSCLPFSYFILKYSLALDLYFLVLFLHRDVINRNVFVFS